MTDALGRKHRHEARTGLTLAQRRLLAMPGLERSLMGGRPVSPQDDLRSLIAELDRAAEGSVRAGAGGAGGAGGANVVAEATWDRYGEGGPVAALEVQVAGLLGKPAAVMFPSGIMAQQSVLRVWSDRQGSRRIAVPGLSHLPLGRPLVGQPAGSVCGAKGGPS